VLAAGHGDGDRVCRDRGNARALIGHHRLRRTHYHAGEAGFGRCRGKIADRARMSNVARDAPADLHAPRRCDGFVHRRHHGDRPRCEIGIENGGGATEPLHAHVRNRIVLAQSDVVGVGGNSHDAVGRDPAQIGPNQHLGPQTGVRVAHLQRSENSESEAQEIVLADQTIDVFGNSLLLGRCGSRLQIMSRSR